MVHLSYLQNTIFRFHSSSSIAVNIYGFARVRKGGKGKAPTGSYTHPLLIRGNPDACSFMIRTKIKNKKKPIRTSRTLPTPITPRGLEEFMNHSKRDTVNVTPIRNDYLAVCNVDPIFLENSATSNKNEKSSGAEIAHQLEHQTSYKNNNVDLNNIFVDDFW